MMYRLFALMTLATLLAAPVMAAVESIGEINVVDDPSGLVPASAKVDLIITFSIDRSQAVPFTEDIRTFELILPLNFTLQAGDIQRLALDRVNEPLFSPVVNGDSVRLILADADIITDTKANRIVEIVFTVNTPAVPGAEALFLLRMLNRDDLAIGEFIRAGNADQKVNNDDFTLLVIPNVPPDVPAAFEVLPMEGENNVQLHWGSVPNLSDHGGYFLYRDGERLANLQEPAASSFLDLSVLPGDHRYTIESYKTPSLRSKPVAEISVTVSEDVTPPEAVRDLTLALETTRVLLSWRRSISPDVVVYRVEFLASDAQPELVAEVQPEVANQEGLFEAIHTHTFTSGLFRYRVVAVDEAGLTATSEQELRLFDKPFPNPFTPLSSDSRFNQVAFRADKASDASFSVEILDLQGTLVWGQTAEFGRNELKWDGRDDNGEVVRGGVYIYQMQLGDEVLDTGTVIVVK